LFNHKTYQVQDVYIRLLWILKNTLGIQVVNKPFILLIIWAEIIKLNNFSNQSFPTPIDTEEKEYSLSVYTSIKIFYLN